MHQAATSLATHSASVLMGSNERTGSYSQSVVGHHSARQATFSAVNYHQTDLSPPEESRRIKVELAELSSNEKKYMKPEPVLSTPRESKIDERKREEIENMETSQEIELDCAETKQKQQAELNPLESQHEENVSQQQQQQVKKSSSCCAKCRQPIKDKFIFSVIDLHWHQNCVQCSDCALKLTDRCYTYEGKLYCRRDYWLRFGPKCFECLQSIDPSELVQRVKGNRIYHLKCFACFECGRQLDVGEQLHLIDGGRHLLCKQDFAIRQKRLLERHSKVEIVSNGQQQQQQRHFKSPHRLGALLDAVKADDTSEEAGANEDDLIGEELLDDEMDETSSLHDDENSSCYARESQHEQQDENSTSIFQRGGGGHHSTSLMEAGKLQPSSRQHLRASLSQQQANNANRRRRRKQQEQKKASGQQQLQTMTSSGGSSATQRAGESILNGPNQQQQQQASILVNGASGQQQQKGCMTPNSNSSSSSSSSSASSTSSSASSTSSQSSSSSSASNSSNTNSNSVHDRAHQHGHHHHHHQSLSRQQQQQVVVANSATSSHSTKQQQQQHKPTRVRTVLNEKQLQTLRDCYSGNPRPDALMKEQLVELTGLSPRVIRVWFQNKRCKDKKKSILYKQMQQHEKLDF